MTFPFPFFCPKVGAISLSYTDYAEDASDSTVYTFTARAIGAASGDRYIVIGESGRASATSTTISSVTVGGISATKIVEADRVGSGNNHASLWIAAVPTGTTATVVVTASAGMVRCEIGIWALTGLGSPSAVGTISSIADNGTGTINVPAGGVAIGMRYDSINEAQTWVGITENFDNSAEAGNGRSSGASAAFATAQTGMTVSCSAAGPSFCAMAVASWGP